MTTAPYGHNLTTPGTAEASEAVSDLRCAEEKERAE